MKDKVAKSQGENLREAEGRDTCNADKGYNLKGIFLFPDLFRLQRYQSPWWKIVCFERA